MYILDRMVIAYQCLHLAYNRSREAMDFIGQNNARALSDINQGISDAQAAIKILYEARKALQNNTYR